MLHEISKQELDQIGDQLDLALEVGLEVEVIYWGLMAMKQNPELTPAQAFGQGILGWVK